MPPVVRLLCNLILGFVQAGVSILLSVRGLNYAVWTAESASPISSLRSSAEELCPQPSRSLLVALSPLSPFSDLVFLFL